MARSFRSKATSSRSRSKKRGRRRSSTASSPRPEGDAPRLWCSRFVVPAGAAADVLEALDGLGVGVAAFEDEPDGPSSVPWTLEILHQSEPDPVSLKQAIDQIAHEQGLPPVDLEVMPIADTDWRESLQASFPPQRIGRFTVYGSHVEANPYPGTTPLMLDAGLAFGSGEHATTRGCLTMLDDLARRRRFRRVLDLGCGSGILAIAAARCWPARVLAADNDPSAVAVARANARANGVAAVVAVVPSEGFEHPRLRNEAPYDLVLANILAEPLIELAPAFARVLDKDGAVIVSGLLNEQVNRVTDLYHLQGLRVVRLIQDGPWATLMFRRLRRGQSRRVRGPATDRSHDTWRGTHGARSFATPAGRRGARAG